MASRDSRDEPRRHMEAVGRSTLDAKNKLGIAGVVGFTQTAAMIPADMAVLHLSIVINSEIH